MSISELGALIHVDPAEAKKRILVALEGSRGDRRKAATALSTTHRSLYRFIERLRLWDEIDQMATAKGFPKIPGPPRTPKRIRDAVLQAEGNIAKAARSLDMKPEALEAKIEELDLWDDLNRLLAAAGATRRVKRPGA